MVDRIVLGSCAFMELQRRTAWHLINSYVSRVVALPVGGVGQDREAGSACEGALRRKTN